jgi:hypothetical protein
MSVSGELEKKGRAEEQQFKECRGEKSPDCGYLGGKGRLAVGGLENSKERA